MDAAAASAVFDWQDGARRLAATAGKTRTACDAVVDAVHGEIRRRVGRSFSVADLARVHRGASDWFLPLAFAVAPKEPLARDPAVTLDGAFALYSRHASDAGLW